MADLATLSFLDITELGAGLREVTGGAASMEEAAQRMTRRVYEGLTDPSGRPACALVRVYQSHPASSLDDPLRDYAARLAGAALGPQTRCLVLIATQGDRPEWCARTRSVGHQCMPLTSEDAVHRLPMVTQLVRQFGLPVMSVVAPDPALLLDLSSRSYNVFHVEDAEGSPYIPAQRDFVIPERIRSVVGFGGMFPTGDLCAMILFSRVRITRQTGELFRLVALNLRLGLLDFVSRPIFARRAPA